MDFQTLLKLKALAPEALLKSLNHVVDQERNTETPNPPCITVYTSGGIALTGHLIHYDHQKQNVLLASASDGKPRLRYIWSSSILAVDILDAGNLLFELSDGEIPFHPAPEDIPTKLEVKAVLKQESMKLAATFGLSINLELDYDKDDETERFYAAKIINRTVTVLNRIAENPLGREALTESVKIVKIGIGQENRTSIIDSTLSIIYKINNGLKRCFTIENLQDQIEQHL